MLESFNSSGAWLIAADEGGGSILWMLPSVIIIVIMFNLLLTRPQRREQAARQALLDSLKKNDHVVTIGGIHGVVTNVRKELDEVKIRVDEKNNTELRVTFASIVKVVRDEPGGDSKSEKSTS